MLLASPAMLLLGLVVSPAMTGGMFDLPKYLGPIEEALPSAKEFHTKYATGFGIPFKMTGYAKKMPAFTKWSTDKGLAKRYGDQVLENIEFAKKETRHARTQGASIKKFLSFYNHTDCYAVASVPRKMGKDIHIPHFLNCGHATKYLDVHNMWFSSGETKSVIHNDDQDNLNCVFSGSKRFIFFHPHNKTYIESSDLGWVIADVAAREDPNWKGGYGAFGGKIDVDNVDLDKYGGWAQLGWWDVQLEAGDCVYIPTSWYHHVYSTGRSLSVNMWWWRTDRDADNSTDFQCDAENKELTIAGCKWGYEGPPETQGVRARADDLTSCAAKDEQPPWEHADSFITQWQRFPERVLIPALERSLGYSKGAPIEKQIELMNAFHDRQKKRRSSRNEL